MLGTAGSRALTFCPPHSELNHVLLYIPGSQVVKFRFLCMGTVYSKIATLSLLTPSPPARPTPRYTMCAEARRGEVTLAIDHFWFIASCDGRLQLVRGFFRVFIPRG